ncbi:MAG TPA: M14 family zinc carboxypeptidase [Solirubrobacter sp.]|nr:M14 family zinc carboxypeptidase [Solirubrobacter sp.]
MVRRGPGARRLGLAAVLGATLLLAAAAGPARADDGDWRLVMVTGDDRASIDQLKDDYDIGYVGEPNEAAIYLDDASEARLRALGYRIGETIENRDTWQARKQEIAAAKEREATAGELALRGAPKAGKSKRAVEQPGETVIMRAYTFTNYAGRFLYVEAHNKAQTTNSGPALQMTYKGPDGVARGPYNFSQSGIRPDGNDNATGGNKLNDAGQYLYHRITIPLRGDDANLRAQDVTVTVAASSGSVDTSGVTEWASATLPPRAATFQKDFITRYLDPTDAYARLDALAAEYPDIAEVVPLPHKSSGYQRKGMAIMSGADPTGSAPAGAVGAPLVDTTGEITAAQPVASIPFTAAAGQSVRATVDAIPPGSTDFILRLKDPSGAVLTTVDTGTSPESISRTFTTAGTYTFEVLGFQGDLGDFTFTIQGLLGTAAQAQAAAVQLFSKAWGQDGGNLITAEFKNPGAPSSPLAVTVDGLDVTVNLATDADGQLTSTAAQVVAAINGSPAASALVDAYTYAGNAGAGVVPVRARVQLSDFLNAPPSVKRGPFDMRVLRIGKQRDGSKTGVFIYCQQHAREWVTPITCVETAERLLRNYATDPTTKAYVDNLDIFILPSSNPDGGHYSFYDSSAQRKNMVDYCPASAGTGAISARNNWGVDLNRNNSIGSFFDGYSGGSSACNNETYAGPFEVSEPEIQNEHWIEETFPKIKFAINIHTHGGYFMWSPGAYKSQGRETLPAPNIGIENYFFDVADTILTHIKSSRNTVILPQRTGPIADVLYSAAGNSADEQYYNRGIISYSFEAGAQRISVNPATGAITRTNVGFQPCFANASPPAGFSSTSCGTPANPNPLLANEGHDSAMEFAEGNYGLLQGALEYAQDTTPPVVDIEASADKTGGDPIHFRFKWVNESSVVHYTTDGSTPTLDSPTYNNQGPRRPGEVLTLDQLGVHTVKWIAQDIKGNVSAVRSQTFLIAADQAETGVGGTVAATLSLSLGAPASFGAFAPGVATDYTASTSATVVSTAGDAALSVADPGATAPGHLVNGAFSLPQPLQVNAASLSGTGGAFAALPATVLTYGQPVSHDPVTIGFKQPIGASDALRTGSYGKRLTFTLASTTP